MARGTRHDEQGGEDAGVGSQESEKPGANAHPHKANASFDPKWCWT